MSWGLSSHETLCYPVKSCQISIDYTRMLYVFIYMFINPLNKDKGRELEESFNQYVFIRYFDAF